MRFYKLLLILPLLAIFVGVNIFLFTRFIKLGNEPLYAMLFLLGINLNLLALLILLFYVGKNILRLFIDRKRNVPGHKFRIQLVSIFLILILLPSIFLFALGSGLVTGYIEKWLTPQSLSSLENTLRLAKIYYEEKKEYLLSEAKRRARYLSTSKGIMSVAEVTGEEGKEDIKWEILDLTTASSATNTDELTKEAFLKGEASDVFKSPEGEYIRAAVRVKNPQLLHSPPNSDGPVYILKGSLKVQEDIPLIVENLKKDYEELSLKLKWKFPLRVNFVMTFGFFTLLIIMLALWAALRISKKITEPVRELTEATMKVASGNLDVRIIPEENRNDEIGYLIENFNTMVGQLREGKKRLQESYMEAEAQRIRLSSILENINTGVLFIDGSGTILSMNRAAERILSVDAAGFVGRSYRELLESIGSEELENLIKGIRIKELRGIEKEIRINIKERSLILRVFITALRREETGSSIIGLLVVFDDITDLVNAQRAMAWQEIASRIAHEVKNPLTPIKLSTERLIKKWQNKESDFDEVFESSTKTIIKEVESLRRLVSDFSQFGRMPQIKKRPVDMRDILRDVYNLYMGFKEINIHLSLPDEAVVAEVDPEQIKRVFINIMDNSIEAITFATETVTFATHSNEARGNIYISLSQLNGEKIIVSIADDGPGIPDEIKDKLFMPHFTTKKGGSGLGLAIAQRIVTEHRGFIKVKDNTPRGAIFVIELPER